MRGFYVPIDMDKKKIDRITCVTGTKPFLEKRKKEKKRKRECHELYISSFFMHHHKLITLPLKILYC